MSQSAYTEQIVRLIEQQGNQAAAAADRRGQIWGGALANLGRIPQDVQNLQRQKSRDALQQQELGLRTQQLGLEVDRSTQEKQDRESFDKILSNPAIYNPDHTINREFLASAPIPGHLRPKFDDLAAHLDETQTKIATSRQALEAAQNEAIGRSMLKVEAAGNDPNAFGMAMTSLVASGAMTPTQAKSYQARATDPAAVSAITKELQAGTKVGEKALEDKIKLKTVESQVADRTADNERQAAQAKETARHNVEMEKIGRMTAGREAAAQQETARHNREMEKAANPFAGMGAGGGTNPATGAAGPTGEDFLKTLPPGVASEVKAYAEGKRPFPSGISMTKLQPLIQMVGQYDPTFDAANYNARNKARTDLTSPSGTGGKTINSLNTAIQHAGKLSDLIETLDNTEYPAANAVLNMGRSATGSTKVTNFNAVAPQLMKEIERAWRGTGGSAGEIEALVQSIGQNQGKQQQREALSNFVELMRGKLDATQQQRDNVLGPTAGASIPILYEQSKPILAKIDQRAGKKSDDTGVEEWVRDASGKLVKKGAK